MTFLSNISVKFRFLFFVAGIVIISLISSLIFVHSINTIRAYRQLEKDFDSYFSEIYTIDHHLNELGFISADSVSYNDFNLTSIHGDLNQFTTHLNRLKNNILISANTAIRGPLEKILGNILNLQNEMIFIQNQGSSEMTDKKINELHQKYIVPVLLARDVVTAQFYTASFNIQKKYSIELLIILFLSILLITTAASLNIIIVNRNLRLLLDFMSELKMGIRSAKLHLNASLEFTEISEYLNQFLDNQDEKINFLKTIGEGTNTIKYEPEETDIIGYEIKIMAERLNNIQTEEQIRKNEDEKRQWASDGIAQFGEILRSERENVSELSFLIIQKLVIFLKIEMGTIFLVSDENKEILLETIAAYAYDRRKYINQTFRFGEGLPGTCALEKEKIYLSEIPEEYSDVLSGVGQSKPRFVLLVPLKIEEAIFGVLELASFRGLEEFELTFIDQLAESIALTLKSVKTNENTALLLKQSQEQAEKLLRQEEEMKNNLHELEKAQEESHRNESEIIGILNAMNESSLVAEFGLNGRFMRLNNKFLELLESPAELILGKHHYEFAKVDKHAPDYKEFWEELKRGKTISKVEQFSLFSGKEIWLQQTYTPITNEEGRIYKFLNIAIDITNAKHQQESLEKQANEIVRQNLEMESLNDAVNSSIIKCELDHEGIITDTNEIFEIVSGLNRKEILGRNYRLFLKDLEKEQFEKIWQEVLKGKTYQGATRRTKPTGEETWLMSTFSPVRNEEGIIYKIYLLALDITEKKLKYQLLEEANKEIERLKNSIGN